LDEKNNYNLKIEIDKNNKKEESIQVGWAGAIINTNDDKEKSNALIIKYQYGHYWLFPHSKNQQPTFFRIQKNTQYNLSPDKFINVGRLEFIIQRYNSGSFEDKGTRNMMEDVIVIK